MMRISMISAAFVAALIGYGSSIALVLSAAAAVSATPEQTASWVFSVCLAKALGSAALSIYARVPVVLAWSTPGALLIAGTSGISMAEAVGAFIVSGVLIALTGMLRPLARAVALIPDGIAAAMLAGVLLPFCMKGMAAAQGLPGLVLPMVAVFLMVRLVNPALAVLVALATGIALAFGLGLAHLPWLGLSAPHPVFIAPAFRAEVVLGLGLPLFLVTMASQNLPGFAVLRAAGHEPPVNAALGVTGVLSAISGLFGAHPINMAAITAAICLGEDTHPDPKQRWKTGVVYAGIWTLLGLMGPVILPILAALPPDLMVALVALALLGPLMGALAAGFTPTSTRFGATVTLAVTASGVTAFGIGAAFWGLAAGIGAVALERLKSR